MINAVLRGEELVAIKLWTDIRGGDEIWRGRSGMDARGWPLRLMSRCRVTKWVRTRHRHGTNAVGGTIIRSACRQRLPRHFEPEMDLRQAQPSDPRKPHGKILTRIRSRHQAFHQISCRCELRSPCPMAPETECLRPACTTLTTEFEPLRN